MLRRTLIFSSSKYPSNATTTHLHKSVLGRWRGRPYGNNSAAAEEVEGEAELPNSPNVCCRVKGRRLPKAERQVLLESFVTKYREMNAGAFPSVSHAQEQVGGSYYIVKSILQELKYRDKIPPSPPAIEENSTHELSADAVVVNDPEAIDDADLPGQEEVTEIESLTEVEEKSTSEQVSADVGVLNNDESAYDEVAVDATVQTDSEATNDTALSGANGSHLEAKEESQTSSSVEILSEEDTTPVPDDLVSEQSNMLKCDAGQFSYKDLDKIGNDMEEAKQNLSDSISTGSQLLDESFEVVSHPCDKSEKSETKEAQAEKHDSVTKERDLPIAETNKASPPSFGDTEDMKKQEQALEDVPGSKCKTEKYEEIPQADKFSKGISGREADVAEPSRKSTLWGNMKSFANGLINIFRKQ